MTMSPPTGPRPHRFTVEEYSLMAQSGVFDEDSRVELLDGEIVEMTPIGSEHASHVDKIAWLFRMLEPEAAILRVQSPIRLGSDSEPEPDLALLKPRDDFYRHAHPTAEDVLLIVEVANTSLEFDCERKLPLYARHGVPLVWLVDLQARRVEVYERPIDGEFTWLRKPTADDVLEIPGIEELSLSAGDLLIPD